MFVTTIMPKLEALRLSDRSRRHLNEIEFVQRDDSLKEPIYKETDGSSVEGAISANGESSKFKILERKYVEKWFPEIPLLYEPVRKVAESVFAEPVILSPFFRSSININVYDGEGTCHAAHVDSNPIANLICLSEGTPLQVLKGSKWIDIRLRPGELITFRGKEIMHRVPPAGLDNFRMVVSMTLYFPYDCTRPEGLDRIAYGEG